MSEQKISNKVTNKLLTGKPEIVARTNSSEKQVLIRLLRNLNELDALINEAEFSANPDARIRFDYRQLRSDFFSVSQGIQAHIQMPDYSPRTLKPISGNYGR